MNNPLYLFVGKSGSGKTTIADLLEEKYDYKQIRSYTTRAPRRPDENSHIFITKDDFSKLKNLIAYTEFNGNEYGATKAQADDCDIYVIDPSGVDNLIHKYKYCDRPLYVFYFDTSVCTRIDRMKLRGDSDGMTLERIYNDEKFNWLDTLRKSIRDNYDVDLFLINANNSIDQVLSDVIYCMRKY